MADLFDTDNAPKTEPSEIVKGDLTQWRRADLTDYSPTLFDLKYSARIAATGGATEIEITATADGDDFLISIPSATTDAYTVGDYHWQAYIIRKSDSERIRISRGVWEVRPNFDADAADPRTHAEIMVDKIESVIEGRASSDISNYSIAGRQITKLSPKELISWRDFYRSEVNAEKAKLNRETGKASDTTIQVRFV